MKGELISWCIVTALLGLLGLWLWGGTQDMGAFWGALSRIGLGLLGVAYLLGSMLGLLDVWVDERLEQDRLRKLGKL